MLKTLAVAIGTLACSLSHYTRALPAQDFAPPTHVSAPTLESLLVTLKNDSANIRTIFRDFGWESAATRVIATRTDHFELLYSAEDPRLGTVKNVLYLPYQCVRYLYQDRQRIYVLALRDRCTGS
jgi:hypothetical protein